MCFKTKKLIFQIDFLESQRDTLVTLLIIFTCTYIVIKFFIRPSVRVSIGTFIVHENCC